jgi:hypothetical protein
MRNGNKITGVTKKQFPRHVNGMEHKHKGKQKEGQQFNSYPNLRTSLHEIRYTSTRMSCKEFVPVDLIHTRANIAA